VTREQVIEIDENGKVHGDDLEHAIASALNRYSAENPSNTPDWILAQFLLGCLAAWNQGVQQRETWYGRDALPTGENDARSLSAAMKKPTLMHGTVKRGERIPYNPDCVDCRRERRERQLRRKRLAIDKKRKIIILATAQERDQVALAARLRDLTPAEYVKRAINASLRREGIDAVLFSERE